MEKDGTNPGNTIKRRQAYHIKDNYLLVYRYLFADGGQTRGNKHGTDILQRKLLLL